MADLSLRDYQQIKEIADRERRSVNQQILVLLEQSVNHQKRPKAEVWERIDRRREAIAARVGIMPDSTDLLAEDRNC